MTCTLGVCARAGAAGAGVAVVTAEAAAMRSAFWAAAAGLAPVRMPAMAAMQEAVAGAALARVPALDLVRAALAS